MKSDKIKELIDTNDIKGIIKLILNNKNSKPAKIINKSNNLNHKKVIN